MSASTEKKNRSSARLDGSDKRSIADRKAAEKAKKNKIEAIAITAAAAAVAFLIIIVNTGLLFRWTTAVTVDYAANEQYGLEAGSRSFTVAEVNYVYGNQYMNISSYASLLGIQSGVALDKQVCTIADKGEDYTWHDYFMDQTVSYLRQMAVLAAYAEKEGITLDADELKSIDDNIAALETSAQTNGYDLDDYIELCYGNGVNESVIRDMMELELLASKAETEQRASYSYEQSQLTEKYAEVADDYDKFSFEYYYFKAETETDEAGNEAAPTDAAMAAAKSDAESMERSLKNGGDFTELVKAYEEKDGTVEKPVDEIDSETTEVGPTKVEATAGSSVTSSSTSSSGTLYAEALVEWVKSADRVAGDIAVIEIENGGYYLVHFTERNNNAAPTEESGDMNYCDYVADALLRNEAITEWENGLIGDEAVITASTTFGARYVG